MTAGKNQKNRVNVHSPLSFLWYTKQGNRWLGFGILGIGLAFLIAAHIFSWDLLHIFPACLFLTLTGRHCPGCGTTRMVSALVDGDISTAFFYNPLMFLLMVFVIIWLGWFIMRTFKKNWMPVKVPVQSYVWLMVPVVIILYWILRNLPIYQQYMF